MIVLIKKHDMKIFNLTREILCKIQATVTDACHNYDFAFTPQFYNSLKKIFIVLLFSSTIAESRAQYNGRRTMVLLPDIDVSAGNLASEKDLYLYGSTDGNKAVQQRVIYMRFDLSAIPRYAKIDSVEIRLYLKSQIDTKGKQFVRVYELKNQSDWSSITWDHQPVAGGNPNGEAIASANITEAQKKKSIKLKMDIDDSDKWLAEKGKNLWFFITANSSQYTYYSSRSGDLGKQPRMVISYHMPPELVQNNGWPQYKYNAQHTGQTEWKSNTTASGYQVRTIFAPTGANAIKSDPVLYNGRLIFGYQSSDVPMYRLRAYTGSGTLVAENSAINGIVKYTPIADRANQLYCVTGFSGDSILVFDATTLKRVYAKKIPDNAQVTTTPVVGFDGSLYLSTNKGVYAFTAMPEFKIKWKYGKEKEDSFGTVALREDEKELFVFNGKMGDVNNTGRLVEIESTEGEEKWVKEGFLTYSTDIPVPVLKNDNGGKLRVLITDNFLIGKSFSIIDPVNRQVVKEVRSNENSISQPVVGANQAYIINDKKLESYRLSDGGKESSYNTPALNAASALALDKDENIYILNPQSGKQSLTMVSAKGNAVILKDTVAGHPWGNLSGNLLLLTPAGSLIARSDNYLYTFDPTGFAQQNDIEIPFSGALSGQYLYRAGGKITVTENGGVKTGQDVIIHSGSGVGFKNGFSVQQGAQLSVKTGY